MTPTSRYLSALLVLTALGQCMLSQAWGQPPEISHLFPDFPVDAPRFITGENFHPGKVTVLCWTPKEITEAQQLLAEVADQEATVPEVPPEDAKSVEVLDSESQVITAKLLPGVTWVKTGFGISKPYLVDLARPCWMNAETVAPKQVVFVYGFGLRVKYKTTSVALRGAGKTIPAKVIHESRAGRDVGPVLYFEVPSSVDAGTYSVFIHNGIGGAIGWRKAGELIVKTSAGPDEKLFKVTDYGAKGDDELNDYDAISKAFADAKKASSEQVQPVVYFPPGKWRTDSTLSIPSGIRIRGASRDLTTIEGFGDQGQRDHPTAVIHVTNHTGLEEITLKGMTWKGSPDYWSSLINALTPVEDVTLQSIRVYAGDYRQSQATFRYYSGGISLNGRFVRLLDSDVIGRCYLGGSRVECIGNTFHGVGEIMIGPRCVESLIDCNRMVDSPTRFIVQGLRQCMIRFNEVHNSHRGTYSNSEETFLSHGGQGNVRGHPTSIDQTSLTDSTQQWKPHSQRDKVVLITAGKGMGQFRYVIDNTEDTVMLSKDWRVPPDHLSEYVLGEFYTENQWYGNLNNTPGRTSLWFEQIGNVVSHHRDGFGAGLDIWGIDRTDETKAADPKEREARIGFHPSWFNVIEESWLDGSRLHLATAVGNNNFAQGPPMFGTLVVRNHVRESYATRTTFGSNFHTDGGIIVGNRTNRDGQKQDPSKAGARQKRIAASHTLVCTNQIAYAMRGISISDAARKTFLIGNEFEAIKYPILDWGTSTKLIGNTKYELDPEGERYIPISAPDAQANRREFEFDGAEPKRAGSKSSR